MTGNSSAEDAYKTVLLFFEIEIQIGYNIFFNHQRYSFQNLP
jgi:hypothetical protein